MGLLARWLGRADDDAEAVLYDAVVARGRETDWYLAGAVPDTIDGRFDMIATILALVLLRLEAGSSAAAASARLTERFVEDMDGQLRQIGIGDVVVGKHMGRMMSLLGGRLGAYRDGLAKGDLAPALERNVYRGNAVAPAALAHVAARLQQFAAALAATPTDVLLAGRLP